MRTFVTRAWVGLIVGSLVACSGYALRHAVTHADRSDADRARDAGRKPIEVLAFLGVERGMVAVDLLASGGWYTEVLAAAVGPEGRVYAQNSPYALKIRDGVYDRELGARVADGRLPNVTRIDKRITDAGLEPGSVDVAITALNFHDLYNNDPDLAIGFLRTVRTLLRPSGVLGLIDHLGNPDADNVKLHRIHEQHLLEAVVASGFVVEDRSDLLRNGDDDRTKNVFDPAIRGRTDRILLRLRNPA